MTALTVLYDPTCGLCRRAHEWLAEQRKLIELIFVPCKSARSATPFSASGPRSDWQGPDSHR